MVVPKRIQKAIRLDLTLLSTRLPQLQPFSLCQAAVPWTKDMFLSLLMESRGDSACGLDAVENDLRRFAYIGVFFGPFLRAFWGLCFIFLYS